MIFFWKSWTLPGLRKNHHFSCLGGILELPEAKMGSRRCLLHKKYSQLPRNIQNLSIQPGVILGVCSTSQCKRTEEDFLKLVHTDLKTFCHMSNLEMYFTLTKSTATVGYLGSIFRQKTCHSSCQGMSPKNFLTSGTCSNI